MARYRTKLTILLIPFLLLTQAKAAVLQTISTSEQLNGANSIPQSSNVSNLSWRTGITIGIGKLKRRYPRSRLIYVDSYLFGQHETRDPARLTDFTILGDDPEKGTIHMDAKGLELDSWGALKVAGNHNFRFETALNWPPRFSIERADELSKQAGFVEAYDSILLEEIGYEFCLPDELEPSWRVQLTDEKVIPLDDGKLIEDNPDQTT